ncbi:hypothetical protein SAMN05444369_11148 [Capnocytophaga haemolytica]|uniref:Uncharacterized protein n=1 Tax=Capnocytophaga haemolytica TaxID=45243 RepID=A0AAX2H1R7_9FLAO|nr:hypothetical protein SAMN05444369_11148 [Capnocytophaga haemolytica]SNV14465.1 Uncharacterised protein [Capnocytophaga haemolytica]
MCVLKTKNNFFWLKLFIFTKIPISEDFKIYLKVLRGYFNNISILINT